MQNSTLWGDALKAIAPLLTKSSYKGQCGRIGIFGGSIEYTGAPYYAAVSALKSGADLSYVVCHPEAALAIKSYSPELIVYPSLSTVQAINENFNSLASRLHAVVLGPGFGRAIENFVLFKAILNNFKSTNLPIIIDADGLYFVSKDVTLVQNHKSIILTPNAIEFERIYQAAFGKEVANRNDPATVGRLCEKLGNISIVKKGEQDIISNGLKTIICDFPGSGRRCGGQGDLLSGSLATFSYWASQAVKNNDKNVILNEYGPSLIASYGACMLTKECNRLAFEKFGRSTTTVDMIDVIHIAIKRLFDS